MLKLNPLVIKNLYKCLVQMLTAAELCCMMILLITALCMSCCLILMTRLLFSCRSRHPMLRRWVIGLHYSTTEIILNILTVMDLILMRSCTLLMRNRTSLTLLTTPGGGWNPLKSNSNSNGKQSTPADDGV